MVVFCFFLIFVVIFECFDLAWLCVARGDGVFKIEGSLGFREDFRRSGIVVGLDVFGNY